MNSATVSNRKALPASVAIRSGCFEPGRAGSAHRNVCLDPLYPAFSRRVSIGKQALQYGLTEPRVQLRGSKHDQDSHRASVTWPSAWHRQYRIRILLRQNTTSSGFASGSVCSHITHLVATNIRGGRPKPHVHLLSPVSTYGTITVQR